MTEPTATHAGEPAAQAAAEHARGITIAGTHIERGRIAAQYVITPGVWTDMPEANPRARALVADDKPNAQIVVTTDGELHYDPDAGITIDRYEDPKYADVRAEGEARHAQT